MSRAFGGRLRHVALVDEDRAVVDLLEAGEHAQAGRLAATGGADEDEELAVLDLQVELVDRGALGARIDPGRLVVRHCSHGKATFHRQERAGRSE